jgi:hypothetical protein
MESSLHDLLAIIYSFLKQWEPENQRPAVIYVYPEKGNLQIRLSWQNLIQ